MIGGLTLLREQNVLIGWVLFLVGLDSLVLLIGLSWGYHKAAVLIFIVFIYLFIYFLLFFLKLGWAVLFVG
jgi:hypothetical protein